MIAASLAIAVSEGAAIAAVAICSAAIKFDTFSIPYREKSRGG